MAQIVLCRVVSLCTAAVIAIERRDRPVQPAPRPPRPPGIAQRLAIAHEQVEQRHRIGRRPFARLEGAIPADRPRQRQAPERRPAVKVNDRPRPLASPPAQPPAALRQLPLPRPLPPPRLTPAPPGTTPTPRPHH